MRAGGQPLAFWLFIDARRFMSQMRSAGANVTTELRIAIATQVLCTQNGPVTTCPWDLTIMELI